MEEKIKIVKKKGGCKKVYIPKDVCCVYLIGRANAQIELVKEGKDLCVEVIASDLECQK